MPRVIFKCPYLKGGSERAASHLHNYVRYMATREGAQHMAIGHEQLPATEEQRKMVAQLLREFPLSRGLFEYEDYQTAPTRGNASEFITRALEDNYDQIAKRDNYVSYIASRPRAQRAGAHALFTGSDAPLVLSQIAAEVAHHPGNVWLPIISLRREDAARLGYDDAGQWKNLIAGYAMEMAEAMKIPWEQFRWYAAFHDQGHHPHIHMVCYSADGRSGYLTREGIARIKSDLAKRIFHQELHELYERQTQRRDELTQEAGVVMAELVQQMWEGTLDNPRIEQFMEHLAGKLKNLSGKKQYGYDEGKLWNKNMVARILEDKRYSGTDRYPAILPEEQYRGAQERRRDRAVPVRKTPAQMELRRLCGGPPPAWVEQQTLTLLNRLVQHPERIASGQTEMEDPAESRKLRRELEEALQSPPVDGERTRNMALRLAEHRLNAIGAEEYETARLQKLFRNHPLTEERERELLCESVRQITYRGKGIQVRLKNGQIMKGGQQP